MKTLKDFGNCKDDRGMCGKYEIKQEAIKWVKYYQKIKYNEPNYAKRRIQMQWIIHFFNLDELTGFSTESKDNSSHKELKGGKD